MGKTLSITFLLAPNPNLDFEFYLSILFDFVLFILHFQTGHPVTLN